MKPHPHAPVSTVTPSDILAALLPLGATAPREASPADDAGGSGVGAPGATSAAGGVPPAAPDASGDGGTWTALR